MFTTKITLTIRCNKVQIVADLFYSHVARYICSVTDSKLNQVCGILPLQDVMQILFVWTAGLTSWAYGGSNV